MSKTLLTVDNLCELLGIGKTTAYQIAKNIKHIKIGRRILVPETELQIYIQNHLSTGQ